MEAVLRKAQTFRLQSAYHTDQTTRKLIRRLFALPLLPPKEIPRAFRLLQGSCMFVLDAGMRMKLHVLMKYFLIRESKVTCDLRANVGEATHGGVQREASWPTIRLRELYQ